MKKILRILLVVCIFFSFFLFLRATDISESIRLTKQLGFNAAFIFLSTFLSYLAGTIGWRYCIDSKTKPEFASCHPALDAGSPGKQPVTKGIAGQARNDITLTKLFMYRHVGNIISIFNPAGAIAGEMFNANKLIQDGVEEQIAYKSVLLSRIMMILSQLIILIIVLVWFLLFLSDKLSESLKYIFYIGFVFFVIVILALMYMLLKNGKAAQYIPEKKWRKFVHRVKEMRNSLAEYIRRRPKEAVFAFISFSAQWILGSLELYFILSFSGYSVKIWDGLFMDTMIMVLKSAVWFIPGQLGAEEIINKFVLYLIGIGSFNLWLSVSILRRVRLLFWSAVAGVFYLLLNKKKEVGSSGNIICES